MSTPLLSVCMIIKNEAKRLAACLARLQDWVDEIIVVDTGSTDDSAQIAREFTAHVYNFKWEDDFSAARNYALQYATGQWILIIDADEHLALEAQAKVLDLIETADPGLPLVFNFLAVSPGQQSMFTRALFPNLKGFLFKGRVHETLRFQGHVPQQIFCSQIQLEHHPISLEQRQIKAQTYLRMIQTELKTALSDHEKATFNKHLADTFFLLGQPQQALTAFRSSYLSFRASGLDRHALFYLNLLKPLIELTLKVEQDYSLAFKYAQEATVLMPELTEGWCYLAHLYFLNDQISDSLTLIEALFDGQKGELDLRWQIHCLLTQARCFFQIEKVVEGCQLLENLLLAHPLPSVKIILCWAYLLQGHRKKACDLLHSIHSQLSSEKECIALLLKQKIWTENEEQLLLKLRTQF